MAKAASPRHESLANPRFRGDRSPAAEEDSDDDFGSGWPTPGPSQDASLFEGVPMDSPDPDISGDLR